MQPILLDGAWCPSTATRSFRAVDPARQKPIDRAFPISPREEIEWSIAAAAKAARLVRGWPGERFAAFLSDYADRIDARAESLVAAAHEETALPVAPRLRDAELPRTTNQLRQAAAAAREGSWALPTIDTKPNIRSRFAPLGPVSVFGPNNFPFAFNSIAGGDFAAAVAAGNPVIAKGHSSHPRTTQLFAEAAHEAAAETGMPPGFVQLLYRTDHEDGALLVAHLEIGASGYTGSRRAGLALKAAADAAGKPMYLELSSVNPVFILPGALEERLDSIADELAASALMGAGQFCTNPGIVVIPSGPAGDEFVAALRARYDEAPVGTLLGEGVRETLLAGLETLVTAGANVVTGGGSGGGRGISCRNTLLEVDGESFLSSPGALQTEAFGNATLVVRADDLDAMVAIVESLEGNLTGCLYSDSGGADDEAYERVVAVLRSRVGRLLNDKMPTGVAVSPAMNHGGPHPATGHPGFTAVGIPAAIRRFAALHCYDNVRPHRLPELLRDENPTRAWRLVDGAWTRKDVGSA